MSDTDAGAAGSEQPSAPAEITRTAGGDGALSIRDAARSLVDTRRKDNAQETQQPDAGATEATAAAQESEPQGNDADPGAGEPQDPGEAQETEPAQPPIEAPRSWTKEEKERFASLPRETQEYLATRETERDAATRRSQNEAAEKLKGLSAKEQAVDQARQQYESALPILLSNLQTSYGTEFGDIQSMDDVQKLAVDDPIRYTRWDAHQKRMNAVQQELVSAQQRQASEDRQRLVDFVAAQSKLFEEKAPEFKDKATSEKMSRAAAVVLKDTGFTDKELGQLFRGEANLSLHDHRMQLLIRDAVRYREGETARAQAAKKLTDTKKPIPPVQRPGAAGDKGTAHEAKIRTLTTQLNNATSTRQQLLAAAALRIEQRRVSR